MKSLKALFLSCAIMMTMGVGTMAYAETVDGQEITDETYIEFYSREFKVSRDEAIKRLDMMANSRPLINELEDKYKESLASIYFDNGKEFKLVVRTTEKGDNIRELRTLADSHHKIPLLIIKNAPKTSEQIAKIIEQHSSILSKKIKGLMMMGYDGINDKIVISIYEPDVNKQTAIKNDPSLKNLSGIETEIEFFLTPLM